MNKSDHLSDILRRIVSVLFILSLGWMIIAAFLSGAEKYAAAFPILAIAMTTAFVLLHRPICRALQHCSSKKLTIAGLLLAAAGFSLMLVIAFALKNDIRDNWDYGLVFSSAATIAKGGPLTNVDYFARYGNNGLFLLILSRFLRIVFLVSGNENIYFLLDCSIVLNCILIVCSILIFSWCMRALYSVQAGFLTECILLLMSPLYLYATFTYTDVYGLLPAALIVLSLTKSLNALKNGKSAAGIIWCILTGLFAAAGLLIKGTLVIFLIAALLTFLLAPETSGKRIRMTILYVVTAGLTVLGANHVTGSFLKQYGVTEEMREKEAFSSAHFLMMAMNPATAGQFNSGDVQFSQSFPDSAARKSADIQELKNRLSEMGLSGTLHHIFIVKAKYIYGTGTAGAPNYIMRKPMADNWAIRFFGKNSLFFEATLLCQTMLFDLILVISIFRLAKKWDGSGLSFFLRICVTGIFLFFCIWERHPRYTFVFLPLLAMMGAESIEQSV